MSIEKLMDNQRILVTGGTGSFGNHFVDRILATCKPKEIIIFSRDEKKQHDMRVRLHNDPRVSFYIGDVRDRNSIYRAMKGIDYVFHAAALKHVPSCEFFPFEAVQTNVIGANNVLDAAEECNVKKIVVLSTDKAVYPINAMGISKAMMEKLMLAKARAAKSHTVFCGVRYGNVMYSRGSILPLFIEQFRLKRPLTVTNPNMTRYLLPLPEAIELVLFAMEFGQTGDVLVRKSPASTVRDIAQSMIEIFNSNLKIDVIGIREGEKLHETLVTREELMKAEDHGNYYRVKNLSTVDYERFFSEGSENRIPEEGYTSENTVRLTLKETKDLILSLNEIKEIMRSHQDPLVAEKVLI
jgi:UDP-glucose 4-epimerase